MARHHGSPQPREVQRRRLCVLNVAFPFAPVGSDAVGGAEQILAQLDAALVAAGHTSIVIAAEGSRTRGALIPIPHANGRPASATWDAVHAAIQRALDAFPVDVIHFHGLDFDHYIPAAGPPALVTLHLPHFAYSEDVFRLQRPNTFFHGVSRTQHAGLPQSSVPVLEPITNGVPLGALNGSGSRASRVEFALAMGRICPEKGFHLAAQAARSAGVPLVLGGAVFGYDSHQAYFRDVLVPLLDRRWFRLVGPLSLERKRRLLAAARCLLIPTQVAETSSLVAMEAAACATPVVAFRAGALPEIVEHGRTGFIVDSVEDMARAIGMVDQIDPQECRRVAEQRFSADAMAAHYSDRYAELAAGDRPIRTQIQVVEITSTANLEAIRADWLRLWRRCNASIFQHPDWLIQWCSPFEVREPWLLQFRRGDRLVGIAPLLVYPRTGQRVLTLMGAGISDDQDVTIEPAETGAVMRALWDYLAAHADRWDVFELENLRASSPLVDTRPADWQCTDPELDGVRPVLRLGHSVTRLADLDVRGLLKDVEYRTKRATREGLPTSFEDANTDNFGQLFEAMVRLHRTRWGARGQSGMFHGNLEEFHRRVGRRLLDEGLLRLHVLRVGEHLGAAFYGFHAAGESVSYLGGFDPAFSRFSPGKLVFAHAIEYAIAHDRARVFDFLRGGETYKYDWGAVDEPLYRRRLWLAGPAQQGRSVVAHAG